MYSVFPAVVRYLSLYWREGAAQVPSRQQGTASCQAGASGRQDSCLVLSGLQEAPGHPCCNDSDGWGLGRGVGAGQHCWKFARMLCCSFDNGWLKERRWVSGGNLRHVCDLRQN